MPETLSSEVQRKRRPAWLATTALKQGLASGHCLLCWSLRRTLRRYLFSFLYEGMMSGPVREEFLQGGGFCRQHFWQAKAIEEECWTDGFGVSILCENLLERSRKDLESLSRVRERKKLNILGMRRSFRKLQGDFHLVPGTNCIACAMLKDSENHYLAVLEEMLEEPDFSERYKHSVGLCLRHLRAAANLWQSPTAFAVMKSTAEKVVHQLIAELREFQLKHDYRHKQEPRGSEWTSPERTIEFLIGLKEDLTGLVDLPIRRR